jgi:succinate dehydrogenase / fumarate reductase cytochrome b subunit
MFPHAMPERPVYLNLLRIHLPVSGWVSILHRLSGGLLFLAVPFGVWGLSQSLSDEAGFRRVVEWIGHPLGRLFLLILTWAFAHHLFAGLRHLALDAHWGLDLRHARRSSIAVLLAGALVTLFFAGKLFT